MLMRFFYFKNIKKNTLPDGSHVNRFMKRFCENLRFLEKINSRKLNLEPRINTNFHKKIRENSYKFVAGFNFLEPDCRQASFFSKM